MAAAAWCDLEELEESQFQLVPRKERNGWKVFLFSLQCVLYRSVQYVIFISFGKCASSGSMSFVLEVVV